MNHNTHTAKVNVHTPKWKLIPDGRSEIDALEYTLSTVAKAIAKKMISNSFNIPIGMK